jgi:epoxyqueuosine reductase
VLADDSRAYVARYALGRDYHKVLRGKLRRLARAIEARTGAFGYRVFVDSAPVLERALARHAGVGWIGKHTNLIDREGGSWFFLGELYTDLPLPPDAPVGAHCGSCRACLDVCPTGAIVAPYELDARRCISYLTIERRGEFTPPERDLVGEWLFGCDVCQDVCPWNVRFAHATADAELAPRAELRAPDLMALLDADDAAFAPYADTAFQRPGPAGMRRNAAAVLYNRRRSAP